MKRLLLALALAAVAVPALAAINIYGVIDLGGNPPPQVIYRQPIVVEPVQEEGPPLYLHVPPGHAKHWRKHCHEYDACGRPVYFVQDRWYNEVYVPHHFKHDKHWDKHWEKHHD